MMPPRASRKVELTARQAAKLARLAKATGRSEAELVGEGIDLVARSAGLPEPGLRKPRDMTWFIETAHVGWNGGKPPPKIRFRMK